MERRAVFVRGIVQGVGFRPHVYRLAKKFELTGSVRNASGAVQIEVEGEPGRLDGFCRELTQSPPPLASIDEVSCVSMDPRREIGFRIDESKMARTSDVFI